MTYFQHKLQQLGAKGTAFLAEARALVDLSATTEEKQALEGVLGTIAHDLAGPRTVLKIQIDIATDKPVLNDQEEPIPERSVPVIESTPAPEPNPFFIGLDPAVPGQDRTVEAEVKDGQLVIARHMDDLMPPHPEIVRGFRGSIEWPESFPADMTHGSEVRS